MKIIAIISGLGYLAYLYVFHVVFLPSQIYEFLFVFVSGLSLILSFYFYNHKRHFACITAMIIYALSFSLSYFVQVFISIHYYTKTVFLFGLLFILSFIAFIIYFYAFIQRLHMDKVNQQKYINQIEKEIYESYIHVLRHDYNQKLYQVMNDIRMNDSQKAIHHLQALTQESYQDTAITISNIPSLNHMFQTELSLYHKEHIPFQYYLCKIEKYWHENYTVFIYQLLEDARKPHNEIKLYIQMNQESYLCRLVSLQPLHYQIDISHDISIVENKFSNDYIYFITLPFSQ